MLGRRLDMVGFKTHLDHAVAMHQVKLIKRYFFSNYVFETPTLQDEAGVDQTSTT